jgi:hypothetical protein
MAQDLPTRVLLSRVQDLRTAVEWRQAALLNYVAGPNRMALAEELSRKVDEFARLERDVLRRARELLG